MLGSVLPRCPCRAEKAVLETNLFEAQERLGQLNTCRQQLEAEKHVCSSSKGRKRKQNT